MEGVSEGGSSSTPPSPVIIISPLSLLWTWRDKRRVCSFSSCLSSFSSLGYPFHLLFFGLFCIISHSLVYPFFLFCLSFVICFSSFGLSYSSLSLVYLLLFLVLSICILSSFPFLSNFLFISFLSSSSSYLLLFSPHSHFIFHSSFPFYHIFPSSPFLTFPSPFHLLFPSS